MHESSDCWQIGVVAKAAQISAKDGVEERCTGRRKERLDVALKNEKFDCFQVI
jgi:hypothetical protein